LGIKVYHQLTNFGMRTCGEDRFDFYLVLLAWGFGFTRFGKKEDLKWGTNNCPLSVFAFVFVVMIELKIITFSIFRFQCWW